MAELFVIGAIFCFCASVQSAVGFAFSLFSNTLFLFAGIPLPETVLLSTLGSSLQRTLMCGSLWRHAEWRRILPLSVICALTLPVGTWLLRRCASLDTGIIKAAMGMLVLAVLLVQTAWRIKPQPRLHWAWGGLAAAVSGILNGVSNNGGPPLILWVHAHDWPAERSRVTPMAITLLLTPIQLGLLYLAFGSGIIPTAPQFYMLVPAIVIGTAIGLKVGKRLSRPHLRRVAMTLLIVIAVAAIAEPLIRRYW